MSVAEGRGGNAGDARPNDRTAHADAGRMYEHHAARIHRFCVRRLGDRDEAADAVQDTFLRAWLALENGVEVRHPLSWLLTIADNVCVSRFRARSARVATTELSEETRGDFTDAVGEVAGLAAALRALPVRQRQALLRREVQGYSYDEIGAELGASRASVAALLHRARLAVANALREARRGVAALVPVPAILRAPFEGGAAAGVAIAGTTTVIAVAQLAGAGPTPSVAAPPSRPAGALAASVEPGRLARPTTVQTAGTWAARAARARSSERAGVLGTAEVARTGPPSQELPEPLPESSSSEDLGGGPTTHGEPGSPPVAEPEAPGPGAWDPELHAEPEPTQSSDRPDSQGAATPPGKQEKGAKGRSTSAPGHAGKPERPADEPSGGSGDTGEAGGESPSLPPQARGNGPPARDDTRDVSPPGKAGGEPETGSGPGQGAAQGNGAGQGSGRGQDKDDGAGKGGSQGKGGGPPSGPSP